MKGRGLLSLLARIVKCNKICTVDNMMLELGTWPRFGFITEAKSYKTAGLEYCQAWCTLYLHLQHLSTRIIWNHQPLLIHWKLRCSWTTLADTCIEPEGELCSFQAISQISTKSYCTLIWTFLYEQAIWKALTFSCQGRHTKFPENRN